MKYFKRNFFVINFFNLKINFSNSLTKKITKKNEIKLKVKFTDLSF